MAQDDYYYEIQLTNKQLVFYFMAGAAGLVLSFLSGVMVGRGVEGPAMGAVESRPVGEERLVAEQSPAPAQTPAPGDFSYPQRLESDRPDEGLERPRAKGALPATQPPATQPPATRPPATLPPVPAPRAATSALPAPTPGAATSATVRRTSPLPRAQPSTAAGFAIQVGAFKDKASADSVVRSLKGREFPAYAVAPAGRGGGLYTVRVGVYRDRADAEAVQGRLNDDKFKPYIIKQ